MDNETASIMVDISNTISTYSAGALIGEAPNIYMNPAFDDIQRCQVEAYLLHHAHELGKEKELKKILAECKNKISSQKIEQKKAELEAVAIPSDLLSYGKSGCINPTIENFLTIMQHDVFYSDIHFNLLKNCAEWHLENGDVVKWRDSDEAESLRYIETAYELYNESKHDKALRILFKGREYDPIKTMLDSFRGKWDNVPRCADFLTNWAGADDSEYTKAVSRLIFDGAVVRAYKPGASKFDIVPVLVGEKQGEGKSTLVRYLALNDTYYGEIGKLERNNAKDVESLFGIWICELEEVILRNGLDENNYAKGFITRLVDRYRKPYDRETSELPRRCIFIGTTNNFNFLSDPTGNRRYFPIQCHSNGKQIIEREKECRDYIEQCYCEAVQRYFDGTATYTIPESMIAEAERRQEEATIEDPRVGQIKEYIHGANVIKGTDVCGVEIWVNALNRETKEFGRTYALEVGMMLRKIKCLDPVGRLRSAKWGQQRFYRKKYDCCACPFHDECLGAKEERANDI